MIPPFVILCIVAIAVCSLGFYKFVWFMSLGYGLSAAAIGVTLLIMYRSSLSIATTLLCLLLIVYGCRLGGFLFIREKNSSYISKNKELHGEKKVSLGSKIGMWIPCAIIYVCEASPVLFRLQNGKGNGIFAFIGIAISCLGIFFEAMGDHQKSAAKKVNPNTFVESGLYRIVRCPNYFGEISFWTGIFVSGLPIYHNVWQWIAAIIGYACILMIMIDAAKRLEGRQNKSYGSDPRYQTYVKKTPILFPFVPLYHLSKN